MPSFHHHVAVTQLSGKIHLVGGATLPPGLPSGFIRPSHNVSVGTHEVYNTETNIWSRRADLPTPRNHAAVGVVEGSTPGESAPPPAAGR